ncbi:MAG: hypothetical protein AAB326_01340, partial [Pseudomonadota bacterium]
AIQFLQEFDSHIETSALTFLQPISSEKSGQFIQYCMGPNYEMALLIAQVTGSVIVTDSESRWQELINAQHRNQGLIIYPWNTILNELDIAPIDEQFLKKIIKSQAGISTFRDILKKVDHIISNNHQDMEKLTVITNQISNIKEEFQDTSSLVRTMDLKIVSPDGGFYDKNVQRLLARSSCINYENKVRAIYGVGL